MRRLLGALTTLVKANWAKTSPTLGPVLGFPRTPVNLKPGQGFPYEFLQFSPGLEPETIETDVVIVGSGCGGGVCAKNVAEAGHRVLVVEKSYYWPPEHLPMTEEAGQQHLFMNGGAISCKLLVFISPRFLCVLSAVLQLLLPLSFGRIRF